MAKDKEIQVVPDKEVVAIKKLQNYFLYFPQYDVLFGNECELGIFPHFDLVSAEKHAKLTNGVVIKEFKN